MIEVLWHGRGGQGAFTAARLLGAAASLADGKYALAFPSFGPERRGAPMRAFTKMDEAPIGDRSAVKRADYVVYLDETLVGPNWADEVKPGGLVLVNSVKSFDDPRILAIDADGISQAILGRAIPNTVFLGAIALMCDRLDVEEAKEAVRQYMPAKLHEKNLDIIDAAVAVVSKTEPSSSVSPANDAAPSASASAHDGACATLVAGQRPARPSASIPTLRSGELNPRQYARTTCFEAGYLVAKNAGWRNARPVVDRAACTGCLQCYMHCPDGTIYKVDGISENGKFLVAVDYDFCKGCGICVKACAFDALVMVNEQEALAAEAAACGATFDESEAGVR